MRKAVLSTLLLATSGLWLSGCRTEPNPARYPSWTPASDPASDPTSVEEVSLGSDIPTEFLLHQNYPNPFNPDTRIGYEVSKPAHVVLRVMNLRGQQVRTLANEAKPVGFHEVIWDGKNNYGQRVASGIYLYRLESRDFVETRKMTLLY